MGMGFSSGAFDNPFYTDDDPIAKKENENLCEIVPLSRLYQCKISTIDFGDYSEEQYVDYLTKKNKKKKKQGSSNVKGDKEGEEEDKDIILEDNDSKIVLEKIVDVRSKGGSLRAPVTGYAFLTKSYVPLFKLEREYQDNEKILLLDLNVTHVSNPLPCNVKITVTIKFMKNKFKKCCSFDATPGQNEPISKSIYTLKLDPKKDTKLDKNDEHTLRKLCGKEKIFERIRDHIGVVPESSKLPPKPIQKTDDGKQVYFKDHSDMTFKKNGFVHTIFYDSRGVLAKSAREKEAYCDRSIYKVEYHNDLVCFSSNTLNMFNDLIYEKYYDKFSYINPDSCMIEIEVPEEEIPKIDKYLDKMNKNNLNIILKIEGRYMKVPTDPNKYTDDMPIIIQNSSSILKMD